MSGLHTQRASASAEESSGGANRDEAGQLFAAAFAVPLLEGFGDEPPTHYDERRQLNVLADGRVAVEMGGARGRTDTLTEVRGEQDDFDRPDDEDHGVGLDTLTHVKGEADDFARTLLLGTETRQLPGERDDFARGTDWPDGDAARMKLVPNLDTKTSVRAEADDFASGELR